jgi:ribonuclease III
LLSKLKSFWIRLRPKSPEDKLLLKKLEDVLGFLPENLHFYRQALVHKSARQSGEKDKFNNERLEYLGDAVLSLLVGEYLYQKFPNADEGKLSELRSRIINRTFLNKLAVSMKIPRLLVHKVDSAKQQTNHSIYGNAFEALIGAIFLDKGFTFVSNFFYNKIIMQLINIEKVVKKETNYKSKLLEWGQKNNKKITFELIEPVEGDDKKLFNIKVLIDGIESGSGKSTQKKKAEQKASALALKKLYFHDKKQEIIKYKSDVN